VSSQLWLVPCDSWTHWLTCDHCVWKLCSWSSFVSGEEGGRPATRVPSVTRVFVGCSNSNETPASQQKIEKGLFYLHALHQLYFLLLRFHVFDLKFSKRFEDLSLESCGRDLSLKFVSKVVYIMFSGRFLKSKAPLGTILFWKHRFEPT